jgi:hypothetical protein
MKAEIAPLEGKYYGTQIEVSHPHGDFYFTVWFSGDRKPSKRQLKHEGLKLKDWKEGDFGCDGHYESKDCYEICEIIVDALNGNLVNPDW